jgi:FtsX-like permease family
MIELVPQNAKSIPKPPASAPYRNLRRETHLSVSNDCHHAHAVNRRKEIAIRTAPGVRRARLLRQLLTESPLISLVGGLSGLLMSHWCLRLFLALSSTCIPRVSRVSNPGEAMLKLRVGLMALDFD